MAAYLNYTLLTMKPLLGWPIVEAAVLKQQISKFYPQILSTEDSFYIYDRPLTEINVIASFCVLNLWIKFWYLLY